MVDPRSRCPSAGGRGLHAQGASILVLLLGIVGLTAPAAAWGPIGHRVVGRLAEGHLSPAARRAAEALLAPDSLAEAATWADDIRPDPASKPFEDWHWVNIDDGAPLSLEAGNHRGGLLRALAEQRAVLCDPAAAPEGRRDALRWLTHLVGDLHQPLHIGRVSDRGGNDRVVLWLGEPSNLHSVWDHDMINGTRLSFTEFAAFLDPPSDEEAAAWRPGSFLDWAVESLDLRAAAYEIGDSRLEAAYAWRHLPTVRRRLRQAGLRLAQVLEPCLAPAAPPAPADR